ncbi:MAG: hypothetical protein C3F06_09015 [Candidatus Methanoperedenaceae archaeon]|nr:MAG: hypothetical protein C3F06_09015 [Candidatus Methanoperedenaceae archaeon]
MSSFANAAGGYLIYGMRENSGIASEVCGLENVNADAEIRRLENIIRDGIKPRIPGVSLWEETTTERIRNFRIERLSKIAAGETPVRLSPAPKIILHIIPFGAFNPASRFDVSSLANDVGKLQPISE